MSELLAVIIFVSVIVMSVQGCESHARDDLKKLGTDIKSDINVAAKELDQKAERAIP